VAPPLQQLPPHRVLLAPPLPLGVLLFVVLPLTVAKVFLPCLLPALQSDSVKRIVIVIESRNPKMA
jgi:hypothetical protein